MDIHIFIGTEPSTELARKVLQFSIEKHLATGYRAKYLPMASESVKPAPKGLTGFSLLRWLIPFRFPQLERAIYLDADQLVFQSIHQLWHQPDIHRDRPTSIWCCYQRNRPQTSVMVIDCEQARRQWPSPGQITDLLSASKGRRRTYLKLMRCRNLPVPPTAIAPGWNHFDRYIPGETQLMHFTRLKTQPWRNPSHPHGTVWSRALGEALQTGFITWSEVELELQRYDGRATGQGLHPYWRPWLTARYSVSDKGRQYEVGAC